MATSLKGSATPAEAMVWTRGLSKSYGRFPALEELDLSIGKGDVFGFVGLNGAGKSTTIRLLCGLLRPSAGRICIGGETLVWPDALKVRRRIGYLPQNVRFHEAVEAGKLLQFYCGLTEVEEATARSKAGELDIPLKKRVGIMSPGQQRKLGLLLATLGNPELLFLDEPTAGLDPEGQAEVRRIIARWHDQGMTVFVSSHILGELQHLCTSVGILHQGRLLYSGAVEEGYEIEVGASARDRGILDTVDFRPLPSLNGTQRLLVKLPKEQIPALVSSLVKQEVPVYGIREQSLEDMFTLTVGGAGR